MMKSRIILALMVLLGATASYSQDALSHEKYFSLLGHSRKEIIKILPAKFGVSEATQSKTNKDSIRLAFYSEEEDSNYTLFIFGGRCTSIAKTNFKETSQQLLDKLRRHPGTYAEPLTEEELDNYVVRNNVNEVQKVVGYFKYIPDRLELLIIQDTAEPDSTSILYISSEYHTTLWLLKQRK